MIKTLKWEKINVDKIGHKQTQLHYVIRCDNSIEGYITSLFSTCKKFGTWNPFAYVIYINPSNQIFLFCENGGQDRVFVH